MSKERLQVLPDLAPRWRAHYAHWCRCTACNIGYLAHKHVFARGEIPCDVLLIGEAPGKTENAMGYPFIGRSGQLLKEWLAPHQDKGIRFAITNTVLCRPTDRLNGDNREPTQKELSNCAPRLEDFIKLSQCRAILLVGRVASDSVLTTLPTGRIVHPAHVLYNGGKGTAKDKQARKQLVDFLESIQCKRETPPLRRLLSKLRILC